MTTLHHPLRKHRTLFRALADEMREMIQSGSWSTGQQLPPEHELAVYFQVSRATLREAIGLLVSDGLILKRHGVGNFVAQPRLSSGLETLQSTTEWITASGRKPGTREKQCALRDATAEECAALAVSHGSQVIEVTRIRTADGEPMIFSRDRVPARFFNEPKAMVTRLAREESLLQVLDAQGVYLTSAQAVVRLAKDEAVEALLEIDDGDPVFYLRQIHIDGEGRPCLYSDIYFNGAKLEFHVLRRRV